MSSDIRRLCQATYLRSKEASRLSLRIIAPSSYCTLRRECTQQGTHKTNTEQHYYQLSVISTSGHHHSYHHDHKLFLHNIISPPILSIGGCLFLHNKSIACSLFYQEIKLFYHARRTRTRTRTSPQDPR